MHRLHSSTARFAHRMLPAALLGAGALFTACRSRSSEHSSRYAGGPADHAQDGASSPAQLLANAGAAGWTLTQADLDEIDGIVAPAGVTP